MKFWLAKTSGVTLREQLTAQIILGITSRDLAPGQRLPSTRELARRYDIHANTVSAAYRELSRRGWVNLRPGSGIYVRTDPPVNEISGPAALDQMLGTFLHQARQAGFSSEQIRSAFKQALDKPMPDRFLVIEPDPGLREILIAEIASALGCQVTGAHPSRLGRKSLAGAVAVALTHEVEAIGKQLPPFTDLRQLQVSSVPAAMVGKQRPGPDAILAVVSKWPEFLRWARTILLAAGIDPAVIMTRDPRRTNWRRGIGSASMLVCDAVSATYFDGDPRLQMFRLISNVSLTELRAVAEKFDPRSEGKV